MKTSVLFICAALIGSTSFAQQSSSHTNSMKEGILKKEGKIWYIKVLPDSMALDNSSVIYANGELKKSTGKIYTLGEGDRVDFEGMIADLDHKIDDKRGMIVMNNHKMWVWSILNKPLPLSNGTYVMPDGTLKLSSGKYMKLKKKDFIDLDGNISTVMR